MGIALSGHDLGVAQDFLHLIQRATGVDQKTGKRMAQVMHTHVCHTGEFFCGVPSPQVLVIHGLGAVRAHDVFSPFKSMSVMDHGRYLGVFGKIVTAHCAPQDQAVWLNSGNVMEPSICVPVGIASVMLDQFNISDIAFFTGASMLVFGAVRVSQKGKPYVRRCPELSCRFEPVVTKIMLPS